MSQEFIIDDEFAHRLPMASAFCDEGLEFMIKLLGPDPLIVWDEKSVLLDGHRRKAICDRLGIPYAVKRVSCASKEDALFLIDYNQIVRRNMSDHEQAIMLKRARDALMAKGMTADKAVDEIAKATKKSKRTVYSQTSYGGKLESLDEEWRREILVRKLPKAVVDQVVSCNQVAKDMLLSNLKANGELWLIEWCRERKSRSKLSQARRERAKAKAMFETAPVFEPGPVLPKVEDKKFRGSKMNKLVTESEKAAAASMRAAYRLFSEEGINDPAHPAKRQLDRAHAIIMETLGEVRTKYVT